MIDNEIDARNTVLTRSQAYSEIIEHGASWLEFVADVGDRLEYLGSEVLDWLGY